MVTVKPVLPAHARCCASRSLCGGIVPANDSIAESSSKFHVLPMLKLPLVFSRALCMRTRPEERTAIMIRRGFLFSGPLSGGGGAEACCPSSVMRMWVMYDSASWPLASVLEKHVSMIRRFSSSNRSARDIFAPDEAGESGCESPLVRPRRELGEEDVVGLDEAFGRICRARAAPASNTCACTLRSSNSLADIEVAIVLPYCRCPCLDVA